MSFDNFRTPNTNKLQGENTPLNATPPALRKPEFFSPSNAPTSELRPLDFGKNGTERSPSANREDAGKPPASFFGAGCAFAFKPTLNFGVPASNVKSMAFTEFREPKSSFPKSGPRQEALMSKTTSGQNSQAINGGSETKASVVSTAMSMSTIKTTPKADEPLRNQSCCASPTPTIRLSDLLTIVAGTENATPRVNASGSVSPMDGLSPAASLSNPETPSIKSSVTTSGVSFGAVSQPKAPPALSRVRLLQNDASYSWAAIRKGAKRSTTSFSSPATFLDFVVGSKDEKQTFTVHRQLATFHSPYVRKMFDHQQNKDSVVKSLPKLSLPDIEPSTFGLLVHFMYTEDIEDQPGTVAESKNGFEQLALCADPVPLTKLYILAERFAMSRLQDDIVLRLILILSRASSNNLRLASELTFKTSTKSEKSSPLQNLLVDQVALCGNNGSDDVNYEDFFMSLPPRMVCKIAAKLRSIYEKGFIKIGRGRDILRPENYFCEEKKHLPG